MLRLWIGPLSRGGGKERREGRGGLEFGTVYWVYWGWGMILGLAFGIAVRTLVTLDAWVGLAIGS